MSRTYRIWRKKPNPERLRFFWGFPLYKEEKKRIYPVHKAWVIRNHWWKTLRHYNNYICKRAAKQLSEDADEFFNVRYRKAEYTEWFD